MAGSVFIEYPDNVAVIPQEENTFEWDLLGIDQESYEIRYREDGVAEWTSYTETTTETEHTFPAYEFDVDKDYEWMVVVTDEDSSEIESDIVDFNTSNPVVRNPIPEQETDIGITDFSAEARSPQDRDVKLRITIADNEAYTDATEYETDFTDLEYYFLMAEMLSRQSEWVRLGVIHPIKTPGTYYIKMQAEDTEGLTSAELEYEIVAIQTLYFIETPSVDTRGPQATHVTVKSPTNEHTANLEGITDDKKIERLVEIDGGDASACEVVANELLDRWGREQVSVSGQVNLTVVLDFKEKVKIVVPEAGIDGEYTLQKKAHDVTGMTTRITCGDIILSDNELLARILDEV